MAAIVVRQLPNYGGFRGFQGQFRIPRHRAPILTADTFGLRGRGIALNIFGAGKLAREEIVQHPHASRQSPSICPIGESQTDARRLNPHAVEAVFGCPVKYTLRRTGELAKATKLGVADLAAAISRRVALTSRDMWLRVAGDVDLAFSIKFGLGFRFAKGMNFPGQALLNQHMSGGKRYLHARLNGKDEYAVRDVEMAREIFARSPNHFKHARPMPGIAAGYDQLAGHSLVLMDDGADHSRHRSSYSKLLHETMARQEDIGAMRATVNEYVQDVVGSSVDGFRAIVEVALGAVWRSATGCQLSKEELSVLFEAAYAMQISGTTQAGQAAMDKGLQLVTQALAQAPEGTCAAAFRNCTAFSPDAKRDNLGTVLLNLAPGIGSFWAICHIACQGLAESCRTDPVFLEMCIKESLRLHPPLAGPIMPRVATSEQTLPCGSDGRLVTVPAGAVMNVSLRLLQTDGAAWEAADTFWPKRWHHDPRILNNKIGTWAMPRGNPSSRCPIAAFFPFGFPGKRMCPAQRIAVPLMMQVVSALINQSTPVIVAGQDLFRKHPDEMILESGIDFLPADQVILRFDPAVSRQL